METKFKITCDKDNLRLDAFLAEKLDLTRTKIKGMMESGHVRVAGKIAKPSLKTKDQMEIEGEIPEEEPLSLTPQAIPLEILYEDDYFMAVNKPKDMVVHPSFGHKEGTLVNAVLAYLGQSGSQLIAHSSRSEDEESRPASLGSMRPGIVHRLDKGTTGVIIVAKNSKTQEALSGLFKGRAMSKTYRAVVEGVMERDRGTIDGGIGRHPIDRKKMAVLKERGRDASTTYKAIERLHGFTCVEAYPKTGRTHQIRVHLAHIGHPVAGDGTYGRKAKHVADRPLLHAYRIEFKHPITGKPISIEAPIPQDMIEFIEKNKG
jgi:23S rRNA pseudouridine1911/1915/1917 synthase